MESRIALETGMHSPWVSRVLSELGHPIHPAGSTSSIDRPGPTRSSASLATHPPRYLPSCADCFISLAAEAGSS